MRAFFTALLVAILAAAPALAAEHKLVLENHTFTPNTLTVEAGKPLVLLIENKDDQVEEFDSADLKREKIISPHSSAKVMLSGLKPGTYKFEGEFHAATAQGTLIVK